MTRRARGDGGITQRHDHPTCPPRVDGARPEHRCRGRWQATLKIEVDGDAPRRLTLYAPTQKGARMKLAKAMKERDSGSLVIHTMTVDAWLTYWLEKIVPSELKPQTLRGYKSKVERYIRPRLGHHRLTDLRPAHIRALHEWMRKNNLAEATVRQTHAILAKCLKDAINEGKLAASPADRVKAPKTVKAKRDRLTLDEAHRVLRAAGDDARWWLALFYGMRQGEVLGLRWRDVDFEAGTIRVEQTLQIGMDGRIFFGEPKSAASKRLVPLMPQIETRLRLHLAGIDLPAPDDLVFNNKGKPIQPKADWKAWRALLDRATLPPWAPIPLVALHSARNTAASVLEQAGAPDRLIAQILGHSQVQITHGYQSAEVARMREALTSYGRVLEIG